LFDGEPFAVVPFDIEPDDIEAGFVFIFALAAMGALDV